MSSMEALQTDKVRSYNEFVNLLRSIGPELDVALPAIAVIGDEGSGKTSVLEALSGVKLLRGRDYTLVLQMNKTKGDEWNGTVKCHTKTSPEETSIDPKNKDVPALINNFLNRGLRLSLLPPYRYSEDLIIVEINSPDVPDLALINLPSIPLGEESTPQIIEKKRFIRKIITNPECIILMVVPCNVDIATTEAFKLAQEADPDGERTIGLLTKPDTVDQVKEETIVDTVQNKVINLKKGFMIVRCYEESKMSLVDLNEKEVKFFKEHAVFKCLYDGGYATFPKLAERLSQELAQHIKRYLPQLKGFVKKELLQVTAVIKRLGRPCPSDEAEKGTFLSDKISTFIEGVTRLATGELLDLTEQKVFSVWRKTVKDSQESFQCKLEAEVALHEQSGFTDFQTFDHVLKDQITLLEEPASYFTLNNSREIVEKELLKLMEGAFFGFPNLIYRANRAISIVTASNKKAAESSLRTLFKMEQFEVQAEGRMCLSKKREKKKGPTAQLYSYYQTICQRLTCQIQMMIRFHIIKESSTELQKQMLQILNEKDLSDILKYDQTSTTLRGKTEKCFIPLTKAQVLLLEL